MRFGEFASYLERLEKTSSRIEITKILAELFKKSDAIEIDKIIYLSLGELAPNFKNIILNLAEKMMIRVIAQAYKKDVVEVAAIYKKKGDLGTVAELLNNKNVGNGLSVDEVYRKLLDIANDGGKGSQERKITKTADLLSSVDALSARYVARIPVGKLRLGFSEKTIIDALAGRNGEARKQIEEAYNIRPDIGYIAGLVKEKKLKKESPKVGVPVVPMLAQRLNSPSEMIKKMGEVAVEPKFDGLRIFIHYKKPDGIKIFTRNMNSIDIKTFPELSAVGKYLNADEVILDTEAVGVDPKREMFLDFQKTIQRRRKHNIKKTSGEIPLQFQVFDILLVDGKNLIFTPYRQRRKILEKAVVGGSLLKVDETTITKDPKIIKEKHQKYLKMGLEGVVVKRADGNYVSGRTGWNWVKMKETEGMHGRLSDTLDCIVMGYFTGKGKRTRFGLGKIIVGIKDGQKIRTLTKVGTGLTEDMLVEIKKRIDRLVSKSKPKEYEAQKDLIPDVWATPALVVEVSADSISVSTKHSLGLSLRFPRFLGIRDDKTPNEATTLRELKRLFEMQKV